MTKTMFHMVNQMIILLLSLLDHNMQNQPRVLSSEYIDGRIMSRPTLKSLQFVTLKLTKNTGPSRSWAGPGNGV